MQQCGFLLYPCVLTGLLHQRIVEIQCRSHADEAAYLICIVKLRNTQGDLTATHAPLKAKIPL
jgi:hypothetical protein